MGRGIGAGRHGSGGAGIGAAVSRAHAKPVEVIIQERLGSYRSGKGDAMNTALALAAGQGRDRVHFYDADITNFDASWIDGAEAAADRGFGVVRHRFPRAATDAMITWMITRPALARLFPGTFLPRLDQPLGGEVLLTRRAIETLAESDLVRSRSDWGIDTVLTYATSVMDLGLYEHHVADGKRHALYGSLDELREMLIECLDAAASLSGRPGPAPGARHGTDPPAPVPEDLKQIVAYDVEGTVRLLEAGWSAEEISLAESLPADLFGLLLDDPDPAEIRAHGHRPLVRGARVPAGRLRSRRSGVGVAGLSSLADQGAVLHHKSGPGGVRCRHGLSRIHDPPLRGDRRRILLIPGAGPDLSHTH